MRGIRIALWLALPLAAQPPVISRTGVFNSASRIPMMFPGGAIARGAKFTVAGVRLGSSPEVWIDGKMRAPVLRATANEVEARMPEEAPLGERRLVVRTVAGASAPVGVRVVRSAFGIYSINGDGGRKPITFDDPARPGETVYLMGTGFGAGPAPRVWVGGRTARVIRTRRTTELDQIAIEVPAIGPEGCAVPVQVEQGAAISNTVTMPIGRAGPCPIAPYAPRVDRRATRSAALLLVRTVRHHPDGLGEQVVDEALAAFFEEAGTLAARWLPLGACATWVSRDQPESEIEWLTRSMSGAGLDAGPRITVASAQSRRSLAVAPRTSGLFYRKLGGEGGIGREPPLLLDGDLLLSSDGGRDAGPFRVTVSAPRPFSWSPPAGPIERSRGFVALWSGGTPGDAMAIGIYSALDGAVSGCFCAAPAEAGSFSIPPRYLANLPATGPDARAGIVIATVPGRGAKPVPAAGLSNAWAAGVFARVVAVQAR